VPRCSGYKADGTRCGRIVGASQSYCYSHDPTKGEERHRNAARAGRGNNHREVRAIKTRLSDLYESALAGRVARDVGSVLAQIANIQLRALSLEREIRQTDDLTVQVERLEDEVRTRIGDR
jgi:hypothetical protein